MGKATKAWIEALEAASADSAEPVAVDLTGISSCVELKVAFRSQCFKADELARLDFFIRNGTSTSLPISLVAVDTESTGKYGLEWKGCQEVAGSGVFKHTFEFRPCAEDVGKALKVKQVRILDICSMRSRTQQHIIT